MPCHGLIAACDMQDSVRAKGLRFFVERSDPSPRIVRVLPIVLAPRHRYFVQLKVRRAPQRESVNKRLLQTKAQRIRTN